MTRKKVKTGRRASEFERHTAQVWVDLYRKAQAQPGGRFCVNPEDEPETQTWIDGNDPEHLLLMLDDFAKHGTFNLSGETYEAIALLPTRMKFKKLRAAGSSYEDAVATLSIECNVSTRTMERWLRTDKV